MRTPIIAGNWKMHKTIEEAIDELKKLQPLVKDTTNEVVIYPSFFAVKPCIDTIQGSNISVGVQNMHFEEEGAYTGEVSPKMVGEITRHVLIGHSERRQYYNETDETVNNKMKAAIAHGLCPTLCIGETLEQREAEKTLEIIRTQLGSGLDGFDADKMKDVVIAYEPIWAIGTGKTATKETAQEVHANIRMLLKELFGEETAEKTRILYGGSVKPANIVELMSMDDIDGGLIGGASLKADVFSDIVNFNL